MMRGLGNSPYTHLATPESKRKNRGIRKPPRLRAPVLQSTARVVHACSEIASEIREGQSAPTARPKAANS